MPDKTDDKTDARLQLLTASLLPPLYIPRSISRGGFRIPAARQFRSHHARISECMCQMCDGFHHAEGSAFPLIVGFGSHHALY